LVWKESINTTSQGDTAQFGAANINKISQLFNGDTDVDDVVIDSSFEIQNGKLIISTFTNVGLITVPDGPTTLVGIDTTDELTNKTLTNAVLTTPTINGATMGDATDIVLDTNIGTKIGTAIGQKLAFYNADPVGQRTGIADVTTETVDGTYDADTATVINDLRTKVNALIQVLEDMGITAIV
jgi:hypothetical protein